MIGAAVKLTSARASVRAGDLVRARSTVEAILLGDPKHAEALNLLGVIAAQLGNAAEAVRCFDESLHLNPRDAAAHCDRGLALHHLKRWQEAQRSYERALELQSDHAHAHLNLGILLREQGRAAAALASFERAIAIDARHPAAHSHRGLALQALGRWEEAWASFDAAVSLKAGYAEALMNRGNVQRQMGHLSAALASYDAAIAARPEFAAAHLNRGIVLTDLQQVMAAIDSFDRAIALRGGYPEAQFSRALALLLSGDFARGWPEYECRWRNPAIPAFNQRREFQQPRWCGEPLAGRTILLYAEQGYGDTLQFCRYVSAVAQLGARVLLEVDKPLVALLADLHGVRQIVGKGSALPPYEYECPLLSLPLAFKTTLETIPSAGGYLEAEPALVKEWQGRLGERRGLRIGLVWSGSAVHENDRQRSIALSEWLGQLPAQLQYISLQKEVREADEKVLAANPQILNFAAQLSDFSETAALCECLDLLISVDTSVAHLSAALGKKTWILLPLMNQDWRWLLERQDSPWYASVTLYRQTQVGRWGEVLARVGRDLTALTGDAGMP